MFQNIGRKIMVLAQVIAWIGIAASCISGFVMMASDYLNPLIGLLVLVLGSLFSWIGSFMTYGFGRLIENSDILVAQGQQTQEKPVRPTESGGNSFGNPENPRKNPPKKPVLSMEKEEKRKQLEQWLKDGLIMEEEYQHKLEELEQ